MMNTELLKKYLEGNTNLEENRAVYQWIKKSSENEKEFRRLRKLHDISLWQKVDVPVKNRKRQMVRTYMRVAAILLLGIVLVYSYKNYEKIGVFFNSIVRGNDNIAMQQIIVPAGQNLKVELADGTTVWLNSKSTLLYPENFSNSSERLVELSGEGFFNVTHDQKKPFIVKTDNYNIKVLGTEFNVKAYEKTEKFTTSLIRGSVEVSSGIDNQSVVLVPNQAVTVVNSHLTIIPVDENELLWREGILSINDKTIPELILILEQYFDVSIIVENHSLSSSKYTGKFRIKDGVEQILKVLQIQNDFSYTVNQLNNTITIK